MSRLGAANRFQCPVPCRPTPVQARTKRREHRHHVADQIVIHFTSIKHHEAAAVRRQRGPDQFGVHPAEPVTVLNPHGGDLRISQQTPHLGTGAIHPRPDLSFHPHHPAARRCYRRRQACHLPVQVVLLVMRGHPYSPNAAGCSVLAGASGDTSTVRWFTRTAGTGRVPSRNHRYAVADARPEHAPTRSDSPTQILNRTRERSVSITNQRAARTVTWHRSLALRPRRGLM